MKRYKDIVLPVFRDRTRRVLRMLVSRDFPTLKAQNPNLSYNELRTRYYEAALRVVKKRRANHVQSWRPDKNGTHLPLIYGGVYTDAPTGALPGATTTPRPPAASSSVVTTTSSTVTATAASSVPATTTSTTSTVTAAAVSSVPATTMPTTSTVTATAAPSVPTTTTPATSTATKPVDAGVDFPSEKELICSCGVQLSPTTAFPKDRWGDDSQVHCERCWQKKQNEMVTKHVQDPVKRKQVMQTVNPDPDNRNRRRKRKKLTQCKHCGSKTHFTIRSKKCPFNKANKKASPVEPDSEESQCPSVDNEDSVDWDAPIRKDEIFDPLSDDRSTASSSTTSPPRAQPVVESEFAPTPGDNVLVTEGKRVFLAQLFKIDGDDYHVYFVNAPGDDDVRIVGLHQLKPEITPSRRRSDYLNAEFYFDGAPDLASGRWKVRRIEGNEFVCVRLSGGTHSSQSRENFDVSYVMGEVRAEEEYVRERGPGWSGRT